MSSFRSPLIAGAFITLFIIISTSGCDKPGPETGSARAAPSAVAASDELGPQTSPVAVDMSKGWCGGHGVPESVCTRCDDSLIAQFKEAGDWCAEHGLAESQCELCNPGVAVKWAAFDPSKQAAEPEKRATNTPAEPMTAEMTLERVPRLLTANNDSLCPVDSLRVRFLDASVASKAGIQTEPARPRRISANIDVPAEVEFDATRVTRVTPRVAGVVREIPARIGDTVKAGDLLAVIDSPVLGEIKSRYIERKQNYVLAQADDQRVRTILAGEQRMLRVVTAESPLETIRQRLEGVPIGESKAQLLRAHAALQLAGAEAARKAQLFDKKVSSESEVETAQAALAVAEADFLAIREEIVFRSERDKLSAERAVKIARAALGATERQLHILGLSDEQVRAIGSEPHGQLARHELRSPIAGRVVERRVSAGEAVDTADVVFVVADNSTMWLLAHVYARDLLLLREGAPVLFTVDGLPGVSFEGRLNWISDQVDDRTRTVRVRADLPNEDGLLRAKMFGRARLVVGSDGSALSVPSGAVQTDGCCQLVFVRENEALFAPRKVRLGAAANGYVEVLEGLEAGELVATTGSFLMKTEILKGNIGAGCCEVDPGR